MMVAKSGYADKEQLRQLLDDMLIFEDEQPREQLKVDFYTMLENEKENISDAKTKTNTSYKLSKINR